MATKVTAQVKDSTLHEATARVLNTSSRTLQNGELMAVLLKTPGTEKTVADFAQRLLQHFSGIKGLARATADDLCGVPGVGPGLAAAIVAAFELGRRSMLPEVDEDPQITSPADAGNLLMPLMGHLDKEHMVVLVLDTKHRVRRIDWAYSGSVDTIQIRVGELFRTAIKMQAAAVIIAHNHPSGDPTPSPDDVKVTEQAVQAGRLLDIEVLDHLVIGQARYVSCKERGLGFGH